MTRVSTYGQLNATLTSIMRQQSDLAVAQAQNATGLKSQSYQGLGADSARALNLEAQLARSLQYVQQGEIVASRVETMYGAVTDMIDTLGKYQSLLSTAMSGQSAGTAALNYQAQTWLDTFVDSANTRLTGRYLFSGDMTDTAPVDVSDPPYTPQTYPSTASTAYYQGNAAIATFQASDGKTITYGVTANEAGFEQAIRALSLGANASENPVDQDALTEAYDLVNTALDALLVTQTKLSAAASALEWEMDVQTDVQVRLEAMVSTIKEVDVAEALTRMETLQTQLEASYAAIAKINEMNLFDYL
jgi:flagellar hook-associated protein 3 FlgL